MVVLVTLLLAAIIAGLMARIVRKARDTRSGTPLNESTDDAAPAPAVEWDIEVTTLQDLSMTAGRSHVVTVDALLAAFAVAADRDGGALDQKILMGKLFIEFVSSVEDLGALVWAIRARRKAGIFRAYLTYDTDQVRAVYQCVKRGMPIHQLLNVPTVDQIARYVSKEDRDLYAIQLAALAERLAGAADAYLDPNLQITRPFNKLKHGFVMTVRLDKMRPGEAPPGDWRNDVNIITDLDDRGQLHYVVVPRTEERVRHIVDSVRSNSETFRALVDLVQFFSERGVPMAWRVPKDRPRKFEREHSTGS